MATISEWETLNIISSNEGSASISQEVGLLTKKEIKLLNALASLQLNYGQTREAIALLIMCRRVAPNNIQTLQLLTLAYIRLKWWEKAEEILQEFEHYSKKQNNLTNLYAALCSLGQARLSEAQELFQLFLKNFLQGER